MATYNIYKFPDNVDDKEAPTFVEKYEEKSIDKTPTVGARCLSLSINAGFTHFYKEA